MKADSWGSDLPGINGDLRVAVRQPAVEHVVPISKFKSWLTGTSRSPRERLVKERIKGMLATE